MVGVVVGSSDVIRAKLLWPLWTRVSGAWKADEPMSIAWTSPGSIDVSGERNLERGFYYFLWALLCRAWVIGLGWWILSTVWADRYERVH